MDATNGIKAAQQSIANPNSSSSLQGLDTDAFLKLMIAQLQNQDPLNPADNNELLQQVNEIRNIGATDKLTNTLDSVLLGQNLTSATALIGKQISALSDDNQQINGLVDHVTVTGGKPKLHIGDKTVSLNNIADILPGSVSQT